MNFVLLIFNIQSNTNIGQLIRTANAFGVLEICVIGRKKFSTFGNQRTTSTTKFRHFFDIKDAITHYRQKDFEVVAVEITTDAESINAKTFDKNALFILGNEGAGIQPSILEQCDSCVFIPQFGAGASINVNVASGIIFNAFTQQRQDYNTIEGFKFRKGATE
ncbi:TrmH family RNA methyltransferase [Agaribacterium sp. ZY112]|uniref:TrmH family RNA methyltransferase n=1 Tax=Agaribacterium sp. ZY112 TaxID=3233574 RepID=UPI0035238E5A